MRKKSITVDIQQHVTLTQEIVTEIQKLSKKTKTPIASMTRDYFLEKRKERGLHIGFIYKYWGPCKAQAMGKEAPPVDPIPANHIVNGVSSFIGPLGDLKGQWVKTQRVQESKEDILVRLLADLPTHIPVRKQPARRPKTPSRDDLVAVYPLGDPHIGMLSWHGEGGADFDLNIAEKLMVAAMRDLVLRGPRCSEALILNCGDFFHYDNHSQHTAKGDHTLDVDGRAPKVLAVGLKIMHTLIDAALEHHDTVIVDNRIGNHDTHTSLMLSIALAAHYRNEPRVAIAPTTSHRAYFEFGKVMIGTTHGDRAKGPDLESLMAAERPEMWGRTKYRYVLCGHVHHSQVKEYRGCIVESFRTLAPGDAWHKASGYHSGRDMRRIVYSREHGEVSREIVNVGALLKGTYA